MCVYATWNGVGLSGSMPVAWPDAGCSAASSWGLEKYSYVTAAVITPLVHTAIGNKFLTACYASWSIESVGTAERCTLHRA